MVEKELEPICNYIRDHGNAGTTVVLKMLCKLAKAEADKLQVPNREQFDCEEVDRMADELRSALVSVAAKCEFKL